MLMKDNINASRMPYMYASVSEQVEAERLDLLNKLHNPNATVLQANILESMDRLINYGPFDLIYCRWLLVHSPQTKIISALSNIFQQLTDRSVFICDECESAQRNKWFYYGKPKDIVLFS